MFGLQLSTPSTTSILLGLLVLGVGLIPTFWDEIKAFWKRITTRSTTTTPGTQSAEVTAEQAFEAALLLMRYKATGKEDPAFAGVMAAVKTILEP